MWWWGVGCWLPQALHIGQPQVWFVLPKMKTFMVVATITSQWQGSHCSSCLMGLNPGPVPRSQLLTEPGWLTPHPMDTFCYQLCQHGIHQCHPQTPASPSDTSITLRCQHHLQTSAPPLDTNISPKYQHHTQTPAPLPTQQHHCNGNSEDSHQGLFNNFRQAESPQIHVSSPISTPC